MKGICLFILMALLHCSVESQNVLNSTPTEIIIEGQVPPAYSKSHIDIRYMPMSAWIGFQSEFVKTISLKIENGYAKCAIVSDSPLIIRSPFVDNNPFVGPVVEPGDHIVIKYENGKLTFSGTGYEKFELERKLEQINDSLERMEAYTSLSDRSSKVKSLNDYLSWHAFLNRKLSLMLPLIETYKTTLSTFAYNNIKVDVLSTIEKTRIDKFFTLRGNVAKETNTNIGAEILNEFGLSNKDLVAIFDSTLNGRAAWWLQYDAAFAHEPYYLLSKLGMDAFREKQMFFKENESDGSIRGEGSEFWVNMYSMGKKKYSGLIREALLAYIFWDSRGALHHCGFPLEIEKILLDYYSQSKFPEYYKVVKATELDYRERFSRQYASNFALIDDQGKLFTKERLKNKVAVLDFWFTGCVGCAQMTPILRNVESYFQKDTNIVFLSISVDKVKEKWIKSVRQKKYTTGLGYNLFTGGEGKDHETVRKYGVNGYPTIYLIDPFDKVLWTDKIPDPRRDKGKGLISLIRNQLALMKDGPYVLYEDNSVAAYTIHGNSVTREKLTNPEVARFQVQTDQIGITFEVSLKKSLSIEPSTFARQDKILVISDIEGNFQSFRKLLQSNNIIDDNFNWVFGNGHLVLAGDMFDRGQQVTECLWLIYSLEEKAKAAGGYIHFVLGNHEIMNLSGNHHYVQKKYIEYAKSINKTLSELYSYSSELGRWLRTKNIVEQIGDLLFVHGGISSRLNNANLTVEKINQIARPNYDKIAAYNASDTLVNILFNDTTSPFWYRTYYTDDKKKQNIMHKVVDGTLKKFDARHIVTGHTIVADTISVHYDNKVINTDTKHAEGKSEALFIHGDNFYRVSAHGEKILLFSDQNTKRTYTYSIKPQNE